MTDEIYLTYAERVQKLSDIFNPRTRVITSCGLVGIADAATSYAENVEAIRELRSETESFRPDRPSRCNGALLRSR